ncbi:response regulator [Schlesneria paludicola]|uniref:response regulator n=1 Tax=Schlesneria paludicola TaxID=360056 RepID=UPI00029A1AB9|nr:response regulator [Schlesneria paludicola]
MLQSISPTTLDFRATSKLFLGLAAALILFAASGLIAYINTNTLNRNAVLIAETHEILLAINDCLSLVKDTETGQRGYLLTGDERYLAPYTLAVANVRSRIDELERLVRDNSEQHRHLLALKSNLEAKLAELDETIQIRRTQGFEAARDIVITDRGKSAMDAIRSEVQEMLFAERQRRGQRIVAMNNAYHVAVVSGVVTCIFGIILSGIVAHLVRKTILSRQLQDWLQNGEINLSRVMMGDQRLERLGENVLRFFAEYLDAHAGVFYANESGGFRRVATYGVPATARIPDRLDTRDGLLGQATRDKRAFLLRDVPAGYLTVGSAFGQSVPRQLLIAPVMSDEAVNGVIELGFMHPVNEPLLQLFDAATGAIGIAVRSANDRAVLQSLLEETQRQAEELQSQGEELRVSNEELEEQSRALKESQSRLELQQAELEQTNSQLEEQAQLLEAQRDDVNRTNVKLQEQTQELEQASQYKSDFLANMSHELRTPLNSSLILAKLLADNPSGNLTSEQIRYAETIQSAGNDLLTLINDILDLSKIEAGHMEIRPEPVRLTHLVEDMRRTFQPVADQKRLSFVLRILPGCAETLHTDRQRLEQILKNLLSNAMKFTEKGEVTFQAGPASGNQIAFSIIDTGIGISTHQQEIVFEAFRQADGNSNRKFGGTGLGLSISRELARRLGGDISLVSQPNRGSTFTVTIPEVYDPQSVPVRQAPVRSRSTESQVAAPIELPSSLPSTLAFPVSEGLASNRVHHLEDDRERLTGDSRVILVVEDDVTFASILYDLAHEVDFQCLIALTAEEGLAIAVQYLPSAVVLDVGLPDHSGLSVLDRLKHDARTRHIPVHVISAGDYAMTAMALGAVGYMLKPVKREELANALQQLEVRLAQRMRRVLVVEDDPVQQESLRMLLGSHDVETIGASSAAECLEQLKIATFDCMVLDLSLPDASGYSLLETLSREDAYAFPPVIVYTGRDLSTDEEQKLRKYSKSIIIKGAKSPERLLDEVTLFLHQVVSELPPEQQRMLEKARSRDAAIEGRRILIVEDDVRNVFALTSILEPRGAQLEIARNGCEALEILARFGESAEQSIDLVLMDIMMPEMDGITATMEIRKNPAWKKLPIIVLTAKAMSDDQERCLAAGASDYMSKPLDVEKLLSLVRVWMPR